MVIVSATLDCHSREGGNGNGRNDDYPPFIIHYYSEVFMSVKRPLEPQKNAIIIGASSGIGAALVKELMRQGYNVAAIARRQEKLEALRKETEGLGAGNCYIYTHDVTDYEAIPPLFQQITSDLGGLDLVVYNAGVQTAVSLDEYNFQKDRAMLEINLLGAVAWLNEAAARFERTGHGKIIGIGSVAGDRGRIGSPIYNTSKAGLHTYLEALRNRLTRHGVGVTTVKPGFIATSMLDNVPKTFWVISPEEAAERIIRAADKGKQTIYIPARWGLMMLIIRHIPSLIFRKLSF